MVSQLSLQYREVGRDAFTSIDVEHKLYGSEEDFEEKKDPFKSVALKLMLEFSQNFGFQIKGAVFQISRLECSVSR